MIRGRIAITATLLLVGCASTPPVPQAEAPRVEASPVEASPVEAPPATTAPAPAALPKQIHWVTGSAEYVAAFEQTYRLAGEALAQRVAGRAPGTWAVAIDADETLISNVEQSIEALGVEVSFEEHWDAWVERRAAPALPGARRFLERVRELGGKIAVVTNRRERHCPQTADNLRAEKLPFDVVLCRGEDRDKNPRWRSVEDGTASPELPPLEIVMWLGDNIHDFPGLDQSSPSARPDDLAQFGDRFFLLPNPLYGSWEH